MTRQELTPNYGVLVAIDIAKARNEVLLQIPGSPRHRRLTILNQRADKFVHPAASVPNRLG